MLISRRASFALVLTLLIVGCDDGDGSNDPDTGTETTEPDGTTDTTSGPDTSTADDGTSNDGSDGAVATGAAIRFDLDGDLDGRSGFYELPWPSNARLDPDGTAAFGGFPAPSGLAIFEGLLEAADQHVAFPVMPVAWFRFTDNAPVLSEEDVIPASLESALLLVDIDPDSDQYGELYPVVAKTMPPDSFSPPNLIGVGARQGLVLQPDTTYAFVVMRRLGDADGTPLVQPPEFAALAAGNTPPGVHADAWATALQPLWPALDDLDVDVDDVAAATVFTTGDVVADLFEVSEHVRATHDPTIPDLALANVNERYCRLDGTLEVPQFQVGEPSFRTEGGLFEVGDDGWPVVQRMETIPVVVTIPRTEMPPGGFPLSLYFHGSGGISSQLVDRGPITTPGGPETPEEGPAYVVAEHGIAMAGSAHPVNPERVPGALAIEYLQLGNPKALRDTFRQGAIEQRLYIDALLALELDPTVLGACDGVTLPAGADRIVFDPSSIMAMGQSMGGMYTNIVGAIEPRIGAVVPTGAGGFWSYFITVTQLGGGYLAPLELLASADELTYLHPFLHAMQTAYMPAEPVAYVPRLAWNPLPDHPVRDIYQPIGRVDSYFPEVLLDAVTLAYRHCLAGDEVWPETAAALELLDAEVDCGDYPVTASRTSRNGTPYTGVAVQYAEDPIQQDGHVIYVQREEVRYQYGCFFRTWLDTGEGTVLAPQPLGTPCTAP